jgi:hypothetical protein
MAVGQFRARSGTEIVDASFQLVKANYAPLVTIAAIGSVPALLAALIDPRSASNRMSIVALLIVLRVLYAITVFIMQIALIRATSDVYLGRPVDIAASLRITWSIAIRITVVGIVSAILTLLGAILLIVPGIIVFAALFLAPAVVILEDAGIEAALRRSWFLSQERKLAILGGVLVFFIGLVLLTVLSGILAYTGSLVLGGIVSTLLMLLVWPLYPAFITLHYYDARIRKEGYDIELMAQAPTS